MEHIEVDTRVEAPVEHVWAFLCDTSRWQDWIPRQETSEFSGPYDQVGTTYVSTMKMMGSEWKSTNTVVEVEPLKLIHEHTDDNGSMDTYFRLEPQGDATRVVVESDYEMPGHIPGVLKSFMTKSFFERQMRHMLGDFKTFAEATVPVPA
jgi:carbon monoxide dehydrogenase subunit G